MDELDKWKGRYIIERQNHISVYEKILKILDLFDKGKDMLAAIHIERLKHCSEYEHVDCVFMLLNNEEEEIETKAKELGLGNRRYT
jgi:hypothetical protein